MTFAPAVATVFVLGVLWKAGNEASGDGDSLLGLAHRRHLFPGRFAEYRQMVPALTWRLTDVGRFRDRSSPGFGNPVHARRPHHRRGLRSHLCSNQSLLTPPMDEAEVSKVCWDHPLAFLKGPFTAVSDPRIVSLLLLVTVGVCYYLLR